MGLYGAFEHQPSGASAWLEYNDSTLRIQRAGWDNPSDGAIQIDFYENGTLAGNVTLEAASSGTQNVPGNYQLTLTEQTDPELEDFGSYLALPDGVTFEMHWPV